MIWLSTYFTVLKRKAFRIYFSSFSVNQTLSCKTPIRTKCHFKEETRILDLGPLIEGVHHQTLEAGAELVAAAAVGWWVGPDPGFQVEVEQIFNHPWATGPMPINGPAMVQEVFKVAHPVKPGSENLFWKEKRNEKKNLVTSKSIIMLCGCAFNFIQSWNTFILDLDWPHHLGISYYVNFLGHLGSNGFQQKWRFGTHGNWNNQNLGARFGATT